MGERPSPECGPLHGRRSFRESKIDQGSHPQHKLKRGGPVAPAEKKFSVDPGAVLNANLFPQRGVWIGGPVFFGAGPQTKIYFCFFNAGLREERRLRARASGLASVLWLRM